MRRFLILLFCIFALTLSGCSDSKEEKLPAIRIEFMHYNISGTHILNINYVEDVLINRSEAPTLYVEPPFPGIHLFAYNGLDRTPVTYVPLDMEGDNVTTYIGFESPETVPRVGDNLLIVVEVVKFVDGKYKSVNTRSANLNWSIEYGN
jgi:hypothetical protein